MTPTSTPPCGTSRLGEALARRRIGLVTREYGGVYQACAARSVKACAELGLSPRRRIRCVTVGEEAGKPSVDPTFPAEIRRARAPRAEAVDLADAVIVLSGAKRTREVFDHACETRKPILAAGALGDSATGHFHRVIRERCCSPIAAAAVPRAPSCWRCGGPAMQGLSPRAT